MAHGSTKIPRTPPRVSVSRFWAFIRESGTSFRLISMAESDRRSARETLSFAEATFSSRKSRLFICAWCRAGWTHIREPASRNAIKVAERYADGVAKPIEVLFARNGL